MKKIKYTDPKSMHDFYFSMVAKMKEEDPFFWEHTDMVDYLKERKDVDDVWELQEDDHLIGFAEPMDFYGFSAIFLDLIPTTEPTSLDKITPLFSQTLFLTAEDDFFSYYLKEGKVKRISTESVLFSGYEINFPYAMYGKNIVRKIEEKLLPDTKSLHFKDCTYDEMEEFLKEREELSWISESGFHSVYGFHYFKTIRQNVETRYLFALDEQERLAGMIKYYPHDTYVTVGYIDVHKGCKRKGVGTRLIQEFCKQVSVPILLTGLSTEGHLCKIDQIFQKFHNSVKVM